MEIHKRKILIIDDESGIREQFKWSFHRDFDVFLAENGKKGLDLTRSVKPDLVILDLALSKNGREDEGLLVFEDIQLLHPLAKVIIITGNEQKDLALKAVQMGAYDFYRKPIDLKDFRIIIERALHLQDIESEVKSRAESAEEDLYNHEIIGQCSLMKSVFDIIERTSQTDATILIGGESGTGKELVARAIHAKSPRREFPFVVINCGAIPENLLESELFGHEKGAFTGAHVQRKGKLQLADRGTVFLDEIGELGFSLQVKILRFLQEKEIDRVGGTKAIELDVRIVAATNRNLEEEVEKGNFRADLFYRLSVISILLPTLHQRGEDVLTLAEHFFDKFKEEYNTDVRGFSSEAKKLIRDYSWPGNVRELENKIRRAVIMTRSSLIVPEDLNLKPQKTTRARPLRDLVHNFEECCIREALQRNQGNVSRTAKDLGVNRTSFYDLLHKHQIDQSQYGTYNKKVHS